MMTREQRIEFTKWFSSQIESKQKLLKEFMTNEEAIQRYIQQTDNGNVALQVSESFLIPQQDQIEKLRGLISMMIRQLERLNNSDIEGMEDDDAIKYINS